MYFPYFITYIVIGFSISLVVFFWALKNGQFKDQQRARFLPLVDEHETPIVKISTFKRYEAYALVLLSLTGLAASGAVLIFVLLNANRF
jgi:cbb3-type cytochrome oxidase maturation protein